MFSTPFPNATKEPKRLFGISPKPHSTSSAWSKATLRRWITLPIEWRVSHDPDGMCVRGANRNGIPEEAQSVMERTRRSSIRIQKTLGWLVETHAVDQSAGVLLRKA